MHTTICISNGFLYVKPACLSVLADTLTYAKSSFEYSMRERKRVMTKTPTAVYKYNEDENTLVAPAGLKDRVCRALKTAGYTFEIKRQIKTPESRRKLDVSRVDLKELRPEQRELLEAIVGNTHTTGKAPTGAGKSFLISYICRMYPNANIVITTDAADVVKTLQDYLKKDCGEAVGQIGGGKNTQMRITVSTLKSLHKIITKPDILIVDECHVVGSDSYMESCLVAATDTFKVIGLSASPEGRADNASLVIEAVCGPIRTKISYQTSVNYGSVAQLEVDIYTCEKGPSEELTGIMDDIADKDRIALWHNEARNILIRDIVNKELKVDAGQQILVYCERTEHAIKLWNELKDLDFVLVHGDNITPSKLDAWEKSDVLKDRSCLCTKQLREEIRQKFKSGEVKRAICTRIWQKGVDFPKLNILIRADGTSSEITSDQASGRLSRTNGGTKTLAKIIDIKDNFNTSYLRRFKQRESVYNNHGWRTKVCQV